MKLQIRDVQYDWTATMAEGTLGDWRDLKKQTGFGRQSLQRALIRFEEVKTPGEVLEDVDLMSAIIALIWLCRRHAGEEVTIAEAEKVRLDEFNFVVEEPDMKPDPTQPAAVELLAGLSGDGNTKKKSGSRASSKTSKPQFAVTS